MNRVAMQIRLSHIEEIKFVDNTQNYKCDLKKDNVHVGFSVQLSPDIEQNCTDILLGVHYDIKKEDRKTSILEYKINVTFEIEDMIEYILIEKNRISVKPELLTIMLSVSIGSLRGMLVMRTKNSDFENYPLPLVNVTELVSKIRHPSWYENTKPPFFKFRYQ